MLYRILATARSFCNTPGEHHAWLKSQGCVVDLRPPTNPMTPAELGALLPGYDGVVLGLDSCDESALVNADRLKVISRYGAGYDQVDLEAAARRGIAVTNTPGANQIAVAELTIGLMFALARQLPLIASAARQNTWKRLIGLELTGKTLGLIGFGAIGREVARRALGLGMQVIAHDPFFKGDFPGVELSPLEEVIRRAHIISLHAALTPENHHLINADRLAQMQPGALLLNTARGGLVDEAALYAALASGKLRGAAMDAFEQEPPENSPLLTLDNFIATPHIGATTHESVERMALMAARNLLAVLRGEPCESIVNADLLRKYNHA
jgi:D-3-phosphoglycerate dehydrogenase